MSEQNSLFSHVPIGSYRKHDPETSKAAARSTDATLLELAVLHGLAQRSMSSHELAEALGMELVSVSPRLAPLVRKGKVRDSGQRRKGPSGRNSIVWELTK